jgi:hypothetical protein
MSAMKDRRQYPRVECTMPARLSVLSPGRLARTVPRLVLMADISPNGARVHLPLQSGDCETHFAPGQRAAIFLRQGERESVIVGSITRCLEQRDATGRVFLEIGVQRDPADRRSQRAAHLLYRAALNPRARSEFDTTVPAH